MTRWILSRLTIRRMVGAGGAALLVGLVAACNPTDEGKLPPNVPDPATLKTPAGALARYHSARAILPGVLDRVMTISGVLTDELAALPAPFGASGTEYTPLDARVDLSGSWSTLSWNRLHLLRGQAREARGFLAAYAPESSPALQGELLALEGYADIYLADLFCSGIPLSTVNFDGSYTLAAGSSTADVYAHAVALFDSAAARFAVHPTDSVAFQQLAAVGKGRALLALGRYDSAAAAVAGIPDEFAYRTAFTVGSVVGVGDIGLPDSGFLFIATAGDRRFDFRTKPGVPSLADREGGNGLDYRGSGDPRSSFTRVDGTDPRGNPMYVPAKYTADIGVPGIPRSPSPSYSIVIASGIEARLIQAEAALRASPSGGEWLGILNHLRQTMWTTIVADTVSDPWVPGPLPDLADPGTAEGRINLVFRERAFWLFMTGQRQGDLRRYLRQNPGHPPDDVYPAGGYLGGGGIASYGHEVVVPVPDNEKTYNPKYTGCLDFNP